MYPGTKVFMLKEKNGWRLVCSATYGELAEQSFLMRALLWFGRAVCRKDDRNERMYWYSKHPAPYTGLVAAESHVAPSVKQ